MSQRMGMVGVYVHLGVMVWPGVILMCPSRSSKELERLERALT
jgi:hypothetical protein